MSKAGDDSSVAGSIKPSRRASVGDQPATRRGSVSESRAKEEVNVQVVVRCRPLNEDEKRSGQPSVITCDSENKSVKVAYGPLAKKITKSYNFDKVFGVYSRQAEVFDSVVRPIVEEALAGFNCTIFAYGQTGTG